MRNDEKGGAVYPLESEEAPFRDFGVNVHVVWPGQPSALYHSESGQEAFLVLSGECMLLVEEQERPLRQWDFVHCPADTRHIFVGAGAGPCAILMIGARPEDGTLLPGKRHRGEVRRVRRERDLQPQRGVLRLAGR